MFFITLIGLIFFGIFLIIGFVIEFRKWRLNKMVANLSSPKQLPIIGVSHWFIGKDNEGIMETTVDMAKQLNTPFKVWFGPQLVICIADPDDMQIILSSENCLQKGYMYKFLHNDTGIFTADADVWKQHRRLLNSTFAPKIVNGFIPKVNEKCKTMIRKMLENQRVSIDFYKIVFKCALEITVSTSLGVQMDLQNEEGDMVHEAFTNSFQYVGRRMFNFWVRYNFIYRRTKAFVEEAKHLNRGYQLITKIKRTKENELAEQLKLGKDVLEEERASNSLNWINKCLLLRRDGIFSEQNVDEEIDTIFVGGIDTTTLTVSNAIMMLAVHQDAQEKVVNELRELFETADSDVSFDDTSKMCYTEMVLKESMRLFPAGPFLSRECLDSVPFRDNIIPKGTLILMLFCKMNRDQKIWGPTADIFDPDRFLPIHADKRHPYSFLPFSAGPRNCIGIRHAMISTKIMLAHLLRNYRFTTDLKLEDIRLRMDVTMKIVNENPIKYEKRIFK